MSINYNDNDMSWDSSDDDEPWLQIEPGRSYEDNPDSWQWRAPTLNERKKTIKEWLDFASTLENQRDDLAPVAADLELIIDECIELQEETDAIIAENAAVLTEVEKELEEINKQRVELDEQEAEIDEELSELEQELKNAENSVPRDDALIAELKQRQADLQELKQGCIADRAKLDESEKELNQVWEKASNSCKIVHKPEPKSLYATATAAVDTFERVSGKNTDNRNSNNLDTNNRSREDHSRDKDNTRETSSSNPMSEAERNNKLCDNRLGHMEKLKVDITALRDQKVNDVGEIKKLSTEIKAQVQNTKNQVQNVSQNTQNRREKLNVIRNERLNKMKTSLDLSPEKDTDQPLANKLKNGDQKISKSLTSQVEQEKALRTKQDAQNADENKDNTSSTQKSGGR